MPDSFDQAMDIEERILERNRADAARTAREKLAPPEKPDEDDKGNRFCLDCGDRIPRKRVASVNAVRCVACAQLREKFRVRTAR